MRGLETLKPVTKAFLTTDELRERIIEDLSDYTEKDARDDVLLYVAFGLVKRDVDLYNLLVDLQTEQVAGFYDPDTEEIVASNVPMIGIKAANIPFDPEQGDKVRIGKRLFEVTDSQEDGQGGIRIILHRV